MGNLQKKNRIYLLIIMLILIVFTFFVFILLKANNNLNKESETIPIDDYLKSNIKIEYIPKDWIISNENNCYDFVKSDHVCTIIKDYQFKFIHIVENIDINSDNQSISLGLLDRSELQDAYIKKLTNSEYSMVRLDYKNGNDKEGLIISGIIFIKSSELDKTETKFVEYKQSLILGEEIHTIVYVKEPRNHAVFQRNLSQHESIKSLDKITDSILIK